MFRVPPRASNDWTVFRRALPFMDPPSPIQYFSPPLLTHISILGGNNVIWTIIALSLWFDKMNVLFNFVKYFSPWMRSQFAVLLFSKNVIRKEKKLLLLVSWESKSVLYICVGDPHGLVHKLFLIYLFGYHWLYTSLDWKMSWLEMPWLERPVFVQPPREKPKNMSRIFFFFFVPNASLAHIAILKCSF